MRIKTNNTNTIEYLIFLLLIYLPVTAVIATILPFAGLLKDVICICVIILSLSTGRIRIDSDSIGQILYVVIVFFSLAINDTQSIAVKTDLFRYRCEYLITFMIGFSWYYEKERDVEVFIKKAIKCIYIMGVVVATAGVIELYNPSFVYKIYGSNLTKHLSLLYGSSRVTRLLSTMGNPITFGLYLSIATLTGVYYYDNQGIIKKPKIIIIISVFVFLVEIFLTYSRTAYFVIFGSLIIYYLTKVIYADHGSKKIRTVLLVSSLFIIIYLFLQTNNSLLYRLSSIDAEGFTSNTRYTRAISAFNNSNNNIFSYMVGHGVGLVLGGSTQYVFEFGYASLFYESGIIGVLVFLLCSIRSVYRSVKTIKINTHNNVLLAMYIAFFSAFLLGMFTADVYAQYPFNLMFWFFYYSLQKYLSIEYPKG